MKTSDRSFGKFIAARLDNLREPGWPRRIILLAILVGIGFIPYPLSITGDFEVISLKPVNVRSKVQGVLVEVSVKMGERVKEGQIVGKLRDTELQLERGKVAAELAEVDAHLRLTKKGFRPEEIQIARLRAEGLRADVELKAANLKRETRLFAAKDSSKARLDEARSAYVQAQKSYDQATQEAKKLSAGFRDEEVAQALAQVEQLKARLALIDQQLEWVVLKAPMDGQIVTPDHELQNLIGSAVAAGAPVMEVVAPADLVARVDVPESEFGDVHMGQSVLLRSYQYPSVSYTGKVEGIQAQVIQAHEFASVIPVITHVSDGNWGELRIHTKGRAKIELGSTPLGYVVYRRVVHSTLVKIWSWY